MALDRFGRYEILAEAGRGGMAIVYRARDPQLERTVALKVLPREFMHDPSFLERFRREAHLIAKLEHQAIVPLYDFGEHEGQPFLVMRYMVGGSLEDWLRRGPLRLEEALRIMQRICTALEKAHGQGILHRDLKPGNILFDEDGVAYLSDFGIARLVEETNTITIIGTPQYMAPEQAHGHPLDSRTDIYQLGVVLFNTLSGRVPFNADTPPALLYKHAYEPVPPIREFAPNLPPSIETLIRRAMAKSKEDRYQSALALLAAMTDVAAGKLLPQEVETVAGVGTGGADGFVADDGLKKARPSRAYALYAGLAVLVLILGGWLFFNLLGGGGEPGEAAAALVESEPTGSAAAMEAIDTAEPTLAAESSPTEMSSSTPEPTTTSTPSATPQPRYRIVGDSATVHSGPGTAFEAIDSVSGGQTVLVVGRTEDALWYNVELEDGVRAWLAAASGEAVDEASLANVPVAATVPAPPITSPGETTPVGTTLEATTPEEITPTPSQSTNAVSDRDGDGFADESDDCPDEFGVSERGGCPFEGPSETDTPAPPVPSATLPPQPTATEEPYPYP